MSTGFAGTSFEPMWNTKQAAEFLGLKPKTVLNRVSTGEFPKPMKNGRLNAFRPSEIVAYRDRILGLAEEKPGVAAPGSRTTD